jgi:hypothetical protein
MIRIAEYYRCSNSRIPYHDAWVYTDDPPVEVERDGVIYKLDKDETEIGDEGVVIFKYFEEEI